MADEDQSRDRIPSQALLDADLLWALLEHMEEGLYLVDPERRILYWNHGAELITGYRAMEVTGRACGRGLLMHCNAEGAGLCGCACPLSEVMQDGKPRECVVFLRHKHGHRVPVRVRSRPVRDGGGRIVGAMEVFDEAVAPARMQVEHLIEYGCCDELTGLANRTYGEIRTMQAIEILDRFGIPFGWLRVALDEVEALEHRFGHGFIDAAVKVAARTLNGNLGPFDVLIRWDRTEFRVVAHHSTSRRLLELAHKLVILVHCSAVSWWGDAVQVTATAGGALAAQGDSLEQLEANAGEAFARSRSAGGNGAFVMHTRPADAESGDPLQIQ
jgi:diguanylate cyclase (GGDEF)-like protein/PAS domain S-box-containing protein